MSFEVLKENDARLELTFQQLKKALEEAHESYKSKREQIMLAFEECQKNDAVALGEVSAALEKIMPQKEQSKI
jgi:hypothetical protein